MSVGFDTTVRLALYKEFVRTGLPPTAEGLQRSCNIRSTRSVEYWNA